MRPTLLIHIAQGPEESIEWLTCSGDQTVACADFGGGALGEVGSLGHGREVRILISGPDIILTAAQVPGRQRQQIAAALPYLVEDQFIEEVEAIHFALGPRGEDGLVHAAAINHERMQSWRQRLGEAGIEPISINPGILSIPFDDDGWTVMEHHGLMHIRSGPASGFTCAPEHLEPLLRQLSEDEKPGLIHLLTFSDSEPTQLTSADQTVGGIKSEWRHHDAHLLEVMAGSLTKKGQINLLQGPYSRSTKFNQVWIKWRSAAILVGLLITALLANTVSRVLELESRNDRLHKEVRAIYREAFPDEKRIVKPRVQMQRHLDALRQGSGNTTATWIMDTLDRAGPVLIGTPGLVLQRLTYKNETFSLRLDLPNLGGVEQLKNKLSALQDIHVEIVTASANNGRVTANLLLRPKS